MKYNITGKVLILFSFKRKGEKIDIDSAHTFCKDKVWVEYPVRQHETMMLKVNTEIEAVSEEEAIKTLQNELEQPEKWSIGLHDADDRYLDSLEPEEIKIVNLDVVAEEIGLTDYELREIEIEMKIDALMEVEA